MDFPTYITGNPNKLKELQQILGFNLESFEMDIPEIQELDVSKVVKEKTLVAFEKLKKPVLIEDTSLEIEALGGLPGPFIKWFLRALSNEGVCRILRPEKNRRATARVAFGLFDGTDYYEFTEAVEGEITEQPLGNSNFGWDPIFKPRGSEKTYGQMTVEEKNSTSPRKQALDRLGKFLDNPK